jgi:hypothetical protein
MIIALHEYYYEVNFSLYHYCKACIPRVLSEMGHLSVEASGCLVVFALRDEWNNLGVSNLPRDARYDTTLAGIAIINLIQRGQREIDPSATLTCFTPIKDNERAGNLDTILKDLDLLSTHSRTVCCKDFSINGHDFIRSVLVKPLILGRVK